MRNLFKRLTYSFITAPVGDYIEKEGVAVQESIAKGLVIRAPKGFTSPGSGDSPFKRPIEDDPKRQLQPDDGIGMRQNEVAYIAVVTIEDPAISVFTQKCRNIGAELFQRFFNPARFPEDSIEFNVRHTDILRNMTGYSSLSGT